MREQNGGRAPASALTSRLRAGVGCDLDYVTEATTVGQSHVGLGVGEQGLAAAGAELAAIGETVFRA